MEVNHALIEARNGEEALALLRAGESIPDVIFLDLNMPRINGIDFLKILKKEHDLTKTRQQLYFLKHVLI